MTVRITAIVPNWNYARYLPERLASIRRQTRAPDALVFLDDASEDNSLAVARAALEGWGVPVEWITSPRNSGSVLGQWAGGLHRARTEAVWIAEADDSAQPNLLEELASRLEDDQEAIFAFADSATMNAAGDIISANSKAYTTAFDSALSADQRLDASEFLRRCLTPRNSIVNVSAVLWRAAALSAALDRLSGAMAHWLCAGDWRLYVEACTAGGKVHYTAEPLNFHRLHAASVNGSQPRTSHFAEVVAMLVLLRRHLGPDDARDAAMARHIAGLRHAWFQGHST